MTVTDRSFLTVIKDLVYKVFAVTEMFESYCILARPPAALSRNGYFRCSVDRMCVCPCVCQWVFQCQCVCVSVCVPMGVRVSVCVCVSVCVPMGVPVSVRVCQCVCVASGVVNHSELPDMIRKTKWSAN